MRIIPNESRHRSAGGDRWQSEEGQGLVEAAFVLPLLLLLIFGAMEAGILLYVYQSMELGISEATRVGITGQQMLNPNTGNYSRDYAIMTAMRKFNFLIVLQDTDFTFERKKYVSGTGWTGWTTGIAQSGDISRVTVKYEWRTINPLLRIAIPKFVIRVSATMMNEAF